MIAKTFEVRDAATFLPVLAICLITDNEGDRYLVARSGYGRSQETQVAHIMLTRLSGESVATADMHFWNDRTMAVVHKYICENFHELETGAVIDVQYILNESAEPKKSERYYEK